MSEPCPELIAASVSDAGVRFRWEDGFEAEFALPWLIDNARTGAEQVGGQRIRTARSLARAGPLQNVDLSGDAVCLAFAADTIEWRGPKLRAYALDERDAHRSDGRTLWPDADLIAERPEIDYQRFLDDDVALRVALSEVARFGIARLSGAGLGVDALEQAVGRFGFIRQTNYGRLFDVRVVADPDNLAFTSRALEPHTDNPYREPAPTLQALHCIRNQGEGGATFFVDGFALAEWLRRLHPIDFARLAEHAVPFTFTAADGERYEARSPVLRLTTDRRLAGLRLNHRALGAIDLGATKTAGWYDSYLRFALEAETPARRFSLRLAPGDMVIFDNERVLHGRDAFSGAADRWLKGCYSDRDGLLATLARLEGRPGPPDGRIDGMTRS